MDHRSLPPVPIKDTASGEKRRNRGMRGGLGGTSSPDNTDIMRVNERDSGRARVESKEVTGRGRKTV